jgi:hypothetical protein
MWDQHHRDSRSAEHYGRGFTECTRVLDQARYGEDSRWAKHLYPIFLTEEYIKSNYLSDFHFITLF